MNSFGTTVELADYLIRALVDPSIYEKHTAWKRMPIDQWSKAFLDLLDKPKSGAFCEVCEWAAQQRPDTIDVAGQVEVDTIMDVAVPASSNVDVDEKMTVMDHSNQVDWCKQELGCAGGEDDFKLCTFDTVLECIQKQHISSYVEDGYIFESSDAMFGKDRLPCAYDDVIIIPRASIEQYVPFDIRIPVGEKLSKIYDFEKIHKHYLNADFAYACFTYHDENLRYDGECVGALMRAFDLEVTKLCPRRQPHYALDLAKTSTVHVQASHDIDMQRFYHFFLAEYLPVVSLARRMIEFSPIRRKLVLHSSSRKWGGNPLHGESSPPC